MSIISLGCCHSPAIPFPRLLYTHHPIPPPIITMWGRVDRSKLEVIKLALWSPPLPPLITHFNVFDITLKVIFCMCLLNVSCQLFNPWLPTWPPPHYSPSTCYSTSHGEIKSNDQSSEIIKMSPQPPLSWVTMNNYYNIFHTHVLHFSSQSNHCRKCC